MKKFLMNVLIGTAICFLAQTYLQQWWIFAAITFIISLLLPYSSGIRSFFAGLFIVFIIQFFCRFINCIYKLDVSLYF